MNRGEIGGTLGRVEVEVDGEWGSVCYDGLEGWSDEGKKATMVICKSLGYSKGEVIYTPGYNWGSGKILMDTLLCNGDEASILDCSFDRTSNCGHSEDLSVSCS